MLVQRRSQPDAPANLLGTLSYDDNYYDGVAGTAFGKNAGVDGNLYVLLRAKPGEVDGLARYTPSGGAPISSGLTLAGEPTSLAIDAYGGYIVGMKATAERPGSGLRWNTSTLFSGEDVLAVHRAENSCLLYFSTLGAVKKYDLCANSGTAQTFLNVAANAIAAMPNGDILLALVGDVRRYSTAGVELATYPAAGVKGLAVDADQTFWAASADRLERYSVQTGLMTETLTYTGSTFEPATVAVNYRIPPKPIIFVHGLNQRSVALPGDTQTLDAVLGDPAIQPSVQRFVFFQDRSPCDQPSLASQVAAMPMWPGSGSPNDHCDSQSEFGLNVLLLHEKVLSTYTASGGQRVILVGYSMGAGIIRGLITYSVALDGVAASELDSVFFVAGALYGSSGAKCVVSGDCPPGSPKWLLDLIDAVFDVNATNLARPAVHQLIPQSSWYQWANAGALPEIGYYEAHANMQVVRVTQRGFWKTKETKLWDAGDGVLEPGTNDPNNPRGGASFSRTGTVEQWQWSFCNEKILGGAPAADGSTADLSSGAALAITNSPCFHSAIPSTLDNPKLNVTDCVTGGQVTLGEQWRKILKGKLGKMAYSCPTH